MSREWLDELGSLAMLETADEGSHRGDPPVFCNSVRTASSRDNVRRGETDVPPLAGRGSGDEEAAVHDAGVWVADEAVAPLLQPQHEALRSREFHTRKHSTQPDRETGADRAVDGL